MPGPVVAPSAYQSFTLTLHGLGLSDADALFFAPNVGSCGGIVSGEAVTLAMVSDDGTQVCPSTPSNAGYPCFATGFSVRGGAPNQNLDRDHFNCTPYRPPYIPRFRGCHEASKLHPCALFSTRIFLHATPPPSLSKGDIEPSIRVTGSQTVTCCTAALDGVQKGGNGGKQRAKGAAIESSPLKTVDPSPATFSWSSPSYYSTALRPPPPPKKPHCTFARTPPLSS